MLKECIRQFVKLERSGQVVYFLRWERKWVLDYATS